MPLASARKWRFEKSTPPPIDPITADGVKRKYGISKETLRKLNRKNRLHVWRGRGSHGNKPCIHLSEAEVKAYIDSRPASKWSFEDPLVSPPPTDPITAISAVRTFGIAEVTLLRLNKKGILHAWEGQKKNVPCIHLSEAEVKAYIDSRPASKWSFEDPLVSPPPKNPITAQSVREKLGIAQETLLKLNHEGRIHAWKGRAAKGRPCIHLSKREISKYIKSKIAASNSATDHEPAVINLLDSIPVGAKPISRLARQFRLSLVTLTEQCKWRRHPALGRKANSGFVDLNAKNGNETSGQKISPSDLGAWHGQWMMEADAKAIADALRESPIGKKFPGNPGIWTRVETYKPFTQSKSQERKRRIDGIFVREADGRQFFTEGYIEAHCGFKNGLFNQEHYQRRVKKLTVVLPGQPNEWKINVWDSHGVKILEASRRGHLIRWDVAEEKWIPGHWLVDNEIWIDTDTDVWWYSSIWLAKQLGKTLTDISSMRQAGNLTNFVSIPLAPKANLYSRRRADENVTKKGSATIIHHEDEVFEQLGIGRKAGGDAPTNDEIKPFVPDWTKLSQSPPLTSAEIAKELKEPVELVARKLLYFRKTTDNAFGFIADEDRVVGESVYHYRMTDVLEPLKEWYLKRQKKAAKNR